METKPLFFSIILPIYNGAKTLRLVLDSIKKQTYTNFELILYDDASTDQSAVLVNDWLNNYDGEVTFIRGLNNKGAHFRVTQGLKVSKGRYVVLSAQDNIFSTNRLNYVASVIMKNPNCRLITHDIFFGSTDHLRRNIGWHTKALINHTKISLPKLLFFRSILFAHDATIYQREALNKFASFINYSPIEDIVLSVNFFLNKDNTNEFQIHNHIKKPLIYKIKSKKSQTYAKPTIINHQFIKFVRKQPIGFIVKNVIISSSEIMALVRSDSTVKKLFRVMRKPLFPLALLALTLRLTMNKLLTSKVDIPDKFFIETNLENNKNETSK